MLNELFILAKIKEGDIKAFENVFRRYYSPLCWYAAGITGEMETAEEIVGELFYLFWKDRKNYRYSGQLKVICTKQCAMKRFSIAAIKKLKSGIANTYWLPILSGRERIPNGIWSMKNCRH